MINQRPIKPRPNPNPNLNPSPSPSLPPSSSSSSSLDPHKPTKMTTKRSLFKLTLLLSTLLFIFAFYTLFHTPNINPIIIPQTPHHSSLQDSIKIYMYNLPSRFTYGVIESYEIARNVKGVDDITSLKYPGNQHAAEWHLFLDLNNKTRSGSVLTRVLDPGQADLFYVPFFSSLSLVANPNRNSNSNSNNYSDEETQEELVRWLEGQFYWKRNNGRDHVFICQDPNALYKVMDRVKNAVLLVSDFGRLGEDQASLVKDVVLPYSHRINKYRGDTGVENRKWLMFFMGNRYRKEGGKIRDLLFQLLEDENDVFIKHGSQSRESRRMATQGMHNSKFCLHPAGDTPSACRLFDAIVSLCVPVIISDYIELPFEDVIDYRKIAVFVDTESALKPGYLAKLLRGVKKERILEFQTELKKAFSDSDWGGIHDGGRSTTAYLIYLGSNIISWKSAKQKTVSRSSTEAEYKALAHAAAELSWVKNLLAELGLPVKQPPSLYCDNTGATYVCANPVYHSRMKHIALDYHFVREQVNTGHLKVLHVSSKDQLADVLTKPLSRAPFVSFRSKIGVSNGSSILRGRINTNN